MLLFLALCVIFVSGLAVGWAANDIYAERQGALRSRPDEREPQHTAM